MTEYRVRYAAGQTRNATTRAAALADAAKPGARRLGAVAEERIGGEWTPIATAAAPVAIPGLVRVNARPFSTIRGRH